MPDKPRRHPPSHPLLIPGQVEDEGLRRHFGAVGVGTVAAYKLWCHRHGLSTELEKDSAERRQELIPESE